MLKYFPFDRRWLSMRTSDNKTPLDLAAEYGHLHIVKEYFEDPLMQIDSNHPVNALILAAAYYHTDSDQIKSVRVTKQALYKFYWCCHQADRHDLIPDDMIPSILNDQSMRPCTYKDGFTPLMIAVKYQRVKCVEKLLKSSLCNRKVFEKFSHYFKRNVLHICAESKNNIITDLLLDKVQSINFNVTQVDIMGNTPLHTCVQVNNIYMSHRLISLSQNDPKLIMDPKTDRIQLKIRNNDKLTPFHEATKYERLEIVEQMLKSVNDPRKLIMEPDQELRTSLHIAALKGKISSKEFHNIKKNENYSAITSLIFKQDSMQLIICTSRFYSCFVLSLFSISINNYLLLVFTVSYKMLKIENNRITSFPIFD